MNVWKVILATLVIFSAGVITGGLIVRHSDMWSSSPKDGARRIAASSATTVRDNRKPIPQYFLMRSNFIDKLDHELKLSATQRAHIDKVIHDRQEDICQLYGEIEPRVHATLVETRERISMELTPEQQTLYEELLKCKPAHPAASNAPALKANTASGK